MDLRHCRVLVTPTTFGKQNQQLRDQLEAQVGEVVYNTLGRPLTSEELRERLPGCDGYIAGLDTIDGEALGAADRLKVIARYGVGVNNVDLRAASARGIVVANTPHANTVSVAELTLGLIIAAARSIPELDQRVRSGEWPRRVGMALQGKCVGLIGLGAIGKAVAKRLQGWEVRLLAFDPYTDPNATEALQVELVSLDGLLAQADVVSLHAPLTPATCGMINAQSLARLKPGAILVNTARGELVDEIALAQAVSSGHLRAVALDAFQQEPPAADHLLLHSAGVIALPHTGAHTDAAVEEMGWGAVEACLAVLRGEEPLHRVLLSEA